MAMSKDHASCWVHKDLTVTAKQIQALLRAVRASGGTDDCQVRLTGIEWENWMGTEIGRLGSYGFRGTVTAGDGSNQRRENGSRVCESAEKKQKVAEEDGMQRGRVQLDPSRTSSPCLGSTQHPCDHPHALFVR